jgi:hypothetical protein
MGILAGALLLILSIGFVRQGLERMPAAYESLRAQASFGRDNGIVWADAVALEPAAVRSAAPASVSLTGESVQPLPTDSIPSLAMLPRAIAEDLDSASTRLRGALVNIFCLAASGSGLRSTSATGVIVSSSGYILTNAHVAYNFLLADRGVSCVVRAGSPAAPAYRAALAYLPEAWIRNEAVALAQESPSGTGERDFALLAITSGIGAPVPSSFPYMPVARAVPAPGSGVVIGSYGAQFLEYREIQSALSPILVYGSVKDLRTFASSTADVLTLGGSAAAQEGSSGGGVADGRGELAGVVTTSTVTGETAGRILSAIATAYVRREYETETGRTLDALLAAPPADTAAAFAHTSAALETSLLQALQR